MSVYEPMYHKHAEECRLHEVHDAFVEGTQIICKLAGQTKENTHAPRMKLDSAQNVDKVLIVYYIYIYRYGGQKLPALATEKKLWGACMVAFV